jgi:hypothetical protein
MREIVYAMRFTGKAMPVGSAGNMLKAKTTAPSSTFVSTVGTDGLAASLQPADGGEATFESEVTFTGEQSFQEVGAIVFGDGNRLRFSTVGSGYLGAGAKTGCKHGAVVWRVDGGEGQFARASGLITSNFFVGEDLAITDHHFGVIFVP